MSWANEFVLTASDDELKQLQFRNLSMSLICQYEKTIRRVEANEANRNDRDLEYFFGFCEGALNLQIPMRVRHLVEFADRFTRTDLWPSQTKYSDGAYWHSNSLRVYHPPNSKVVMEEKEEKIIKFSKGGETRVVRLATLESDTLSRKCLAAFGNDEMTIWAVNDCIPGEYMIYSVNNTDGSLNWKNKVLGGEMGRGSGEGGIHEIHAVWQDDRIILFGVTANAIYIEGFRLSDGVAILRFASSMLWPTDP